MIFVQFGQAEDDMRRLTNRLPLAALLAGEVLLAFGVALIALPGGFIAGGLLLMADGILAILAGGDNAEPTDKSGTRDSGPAEQ